MSSWKTVNGQLRAKGVRFRPVTKPGKHGTLYLYRIVWHPDADPCRDNEVSRVWAYDAEHAAEKHAESLDDEGFSGSPVKAIERVMEEK